MSQERAHKLEDINEDIFSSETTETKQPTTTGNNNPWGDEIGKKDPMSMRLYFQNINGLSTQNLSENWIDILDIMETNQVDMYGLAETNITWNPTIKNMLFHKLRQHVSSNKNSVKLVSATCDDPTHGIYQPGGVCQVTVGKVAGRAGMSGSDPHGLVRWTYITLQGKEGRKVVLCYTKSYVHSHTRIYLCTY